MKLFIKKALIFLAILICILTSISQCLKVGYKYKNDRSNIKLFKILETNEIDPELLILGSSIAEGDFNSEIITKESGFKTYNAALSGRKIQDWHPLAEEILGYASNTKIVVFDVFPNVFDWYENIYLPQQFYPYLGNRNVQSALASIGPQYAKLTYVPFYELTMLNSNYVIEAVSTWSCGLKRSNYSQIEYVRNEGSNFDPINLEHYVPISISNKSIELYYNLIRQFKSKGAEVVFVAPPMYAKGMLAYDQYDKVIEQVKIMVSSTDSKFLDYSKDDRFVNNKYYFFNNTHLNKNGADAFTQTFDIDLDELINN